MTPAALATPGRRAFYLVVAAQVLFLLAMAGVHLFTLQTGERVLLKTVPVDPRDLFRGDYVQLRYAVSTVPISLAPPGEKFRPGEPVWALLQRGEPHWRVVAVSHRRPASGSGQVAVRGRVNWADHQLHVTYGIESFFVPEGQGRELENRPDRNVDLDVEVAVDRFGNAAIARVLLEGREVRFD